MNKFRAVIDYKRTAASVLQTTFLGILSVALGAALWLASLPMASAAGTTPAEMIQANLPPSMSLANAGRAQILSAICKAVSRSPQDAPQIVRAAAGARKELTGEIVGQAVRCLKGDDKGGTNCDLVRATLQEAITIDAGQAAVFTESVMSLAPGCLDSPEEGPVDSGLTNINPPGSSVGDAGDPCVVCHNNQPIQVVCSKVDEYLQNHPGDTAGACVATPDSNR